MQVVPLRIAVAGTGNVATHLAEAIFKAHGSMELVYLYGRTHEHLSEAVGFIASRSGAEPKEWGTDIEQLRRADYDVLLISIADHALRDFVEFLGPLKSEPLVVHTSGTLSMVQLLPLSPRVGILYPLQTFSRSVEVDVSQIPFFTEALNDDDLRLLDNLAQILSHRTFHADESRRKWLHIAGVFASNFPNMLFEITEKVLAQAGYDLRVVEPLVRTMVDKAFTVGPHTAQTGPAVRNDRAVMENHASSLPGDERNLYTMLSEMIIKSHQNNTDE